MGALRLLTVSALRSMWGMLRSCASTHPQSLRRIRVEAPTGAMRLLTVSALPV